MTEEHAAGPPSVLVDSGELHRVSCLVFEALGLSSDHAATVSDALVAAELRGQGSHGISRLLGIYAERLEKGAVNAHPVARIVERRKSVAVVDGDNGPGQVIGRFAMDLAISMAKDTGVGCVAVRHSNHYGSAAFYLQPAADRGAIGFTTTNAPPNVPPWGGRKPFLGTNPLAIAVPAGRHGTILLDMATSVVAKGKMQLMAKEGHDTIPLGWALDSQGRDTRNLQAALEGMVLPLGGPKGYGLGVIVEILSALLSGADYGPHLGNMYRDFDRPQNIGHFFGALDIEAFASLHQFVGRVEQFVDEIRAVPRRPDCDEILMPGDIESRAAERNRTHGIAIDLAVFAEIGQIAEKYGVKSPVAISM